MIHKNANESKNKPYFSYVFLWFSYVSCAGVARCCQLVPDATRCCRMIPAQRLQDPRQSMCAPEQHLGSPAQRLWAPKQCMWLPKQYIHYMQKIQHVQYIQRNSYRDFRQYLVKTLYTVHTKYTAQLVTFSVQLTMSTQLLSLWSQSGRSDFCGRISGGWLGLNGFSGKTSSNACNENKAAMQFHSPLWRILFLQRAHAIRSHIKLKTIMLIRGGV